MELSTGLLDEIKMHCLNPRLIKKASNGAPYSDHVLGYRMTLLVYADKEVPDIKDSGFKKKQWQGPCVIVYFKRGVKIPQGLLPKTYRPQGNSRPSVPIFAKLIDLVEEGEKRVKFFKSNPIIPRRNRVT